MRMVLVLTQENLIFLESLLGNISIPANCILSHFSALYTYSLNFKFFFVKKKKNKKDSSNRHPRSHSQCPNFSHQLPNPSHTTRGSQLMRATTGHTVNCNYLMGIVLKRSFLSVLKRAEYAIRL